MYGSSWGTITMSGALTLLRSPLLPLQGTSLRKLIAAEAFNVTDLLLRQAARKSFGRVLSSLPQPPSFLPFLPKPGEAPLPVLLPTASGNPVPALVEPNKLLEALAPKLDREDELYVLSLADLAKETLGEDAAKLVSGDALLEPTAIARFILAVLATGRLPGGDSAEAIRVAQSLRQSLGSAGADDEESMNAAMEALSQLSEDEQATVQDLGRELVAKLWARQLERLEPFIGRSPAAQRS
mmetsp:Transcript_27835/g.78723  ORF Transcript_27835/g.78723 Transcript_27835/m.78723 type:complete len:240 (+) Transcript_27835:197-916(+)